jgi:hypothetical protein
MRVIFYLTRREDPMCSVAELGDERRLSLGGSIPLKETNLCYDKQHKIS